MKDYESLIFGNLGQCGLFQFFVFVACNLADIPASWAMTLMSFAGANPDWWSVQYATNSSGIVAQNGTQWIKHFKTCPAHTNETIEFKNDIITIVSEWNLVCENDWIPTTITTLQMVGVLLGAFIMGQLGDLIGRKKSFFGVFFLMMVFTLIASFSTTWQMFAAFRFLIGMTLGGYLVVSYTLPIEYIGTKWRTLGGSCPAWATGVALLGLASWLIQDWRKLSMLTTGIGAPLLLTWWFVPESCRWLLSKGELEEAEKVLRRMAKINRKPAPDLTHLKAVMSAEVQEAKRNHRHTFLDLARHPLMRRQTLIMGFMFFAVVLGYYGFTLGVTELSGNRHLNLFLTGFVEALAVVSVNFFSWRLQRKKTNIFLYLMAGFCSLTITVAYFASSGDTFRKIQNVFAMSAKFFLSAAFTSLFLTMAESFPTVIRNLGFGAVSTAGRLGGMLAPQIIYLHKVSIALPYVICGLALIAGGLLCLLLRDTYRSPLPDDFDLSDYKNGTKISMVSDDENEKEFIAEKDANGLI